MNDEASPLAVVLLELDARVTLFGVVPPIWDTAPLSTGVMTSDDVAECLRDLKCRLDRSLVDELADVDEQPERAHEPHEHHGDHPQRPGSLQDRPVRPEVATDGGTALACCAIGMKVSHEVMNQSAGERVRGELHIQTVNSLHERIKTFLRARRGVATKYLDNYLRWFHLAGLQHAPTPRACLNAAIGPQLKMAVPT